MEQKPTATLSHAVPLVRQFNRFYTRTIGVLQEGLLKSPYSLTEVRVLYELEQRPNSTASDLAGILGIDHGYLSRILRRLESLRFIRKSRSEADGRQLLLGLTDKGQKEITALNARADSEIRLLLKNLSSAELHLLLESMDKIQHLLNSKREQPDSYVLRPPRPGDYGWVVAAHGDLYAREYGWNEEFEGLAARIVADYIANLDQRRDCCWIAEIHGTPVGCAFVAGETEAVAKLRLVLVTPRARGLGIGSRLVSECIRFARQAGYRTMKLWTQSNLTAAKRIYKNAGFELVRQEPHHSFGCDLVGEYWELRL